MYTIQAAQRIIRLSIAQFFFFFYDRYVLLEINSVMKKIYLVIYDTLIIFYFCSLNFVVRSYLFVNDRIANCIYFMLPTRD